MNALRTLAFTGALLAIFLATEAAFRAVHHAASFIGPWVATGFAATVLVAAAVRLPLHAGRLVAFQAVAAAFALAVAGYVALADHRKYVLLIAAAHVALVRVVLASERFEPRTLLSLAALSVSAWVFAIGVSFTSFANVLSGTNPETAWSVVAFVAAFVGLTCEAFAVRRDVVAADRPRRVALGAAAVVAFAWLALRIDGLTADWVPYHRNFFTAPAEFIRQGHWPLWDVPVQYGFLTEIAVAFAPGADRWQGLFFLTAAILVVQAAVVFALLRFRRGGAANAIVAFALAGVPFFTAAGSRYPFGVRLYPQGGLRFIWLFILIAVAFQAYRTSGRARAAWLVAGFVAWGFALAWSVESALWSTLVWGTFVAGDALVRAFAAPRGVGIRIVARGAAALVGVPLLAAGVVAVAFAVGLRHGPDWFAFFEFAANVLQTDDPHYHPVFSVVGPGWMFMLALGAIAALVASCARAGQVRIVPFLASVCFLVFGTASYYFGEPYDDHMNLLAGVVTLAYAAVAACAANEDVPLALMLPVRVAFIPFFVVLLTTGLGGVGTKRVEGPFMPGYTTDMSRVMPTIPRELAELEARAGIASTDRVLFPSSPNWVTFGQGFLSPYVADAQGRRRVQEGWLPYDQSGLIDAFLTLPEARRATYIARYLAETRTGGWLIAYAATPDCGALSPRLHAARMVRSRRYAAALCVYR